jgi:hypothetical protein
VVLVGALRVTSRMPLPRAYLLLIAATLLTAPIAWDHYLAWLLPFLLVELVNPRHSRRRRWLLVVAAALLCVPLGRLPVEFPLLALAPLRTAGLVLVLAAVAPGGVGRRAAEDGRSRTWPRVGAGGHVGDAAASPRRVG